jgi:hypothetical protein
MDAKQWEQDAAEKQQRIAELEAELAKLQQELQQQTSSHEVRGQLCGVLVCKQLACSTLTCGIRHSGTAEFACVGGVYGKEMQACNRSGTADAAMLCITV